MTMPKYSGLHNHPHSEENNHVNIGPKQYLH